MEEYGNCYCREKATEKITIKSYDKNIGPHDIFACEKCYEEFVRKLLGGEVTVPDYAGEEHLAPPGWTPWKDLLKGF